MRGGTPAVAQPTIRPRGFRASLLGDLRVRYDNGSRAIHDTARVSRGDDSILAERGRQRFESLHRRVGTGMVVFTHSGRFFPFFHFHGNDLVLHPARAVCRGGRLLAT